MPLETPPPDNFNALDITWPQNLDGATVGNEHIQQLKNVLQKVFPDNEIPGQFAANLILAAGGTTPGAGVGEFDAYVRDLDVARNATIEGSIFANSQVAIAGTKIDGLDGSPIGANFGVVSVIRIGVGDYQVTLVENAWDFDDLVVGGNVNYALAGAGSFATIAVGVGVFRLLTFHASDPSNPLDCGSVEFSILDRGRDL